MSEQKEIPKETLNVWAKNWDVLRSFGDEVQRNTELLYTMCENCVKERTTACDKCLEIHKKLDLTDSFYRRRYDTIAFPDRVATFNEGQRRKNCIECPRCQYWIPKSLFQNSERNE